MNKLSNHGTGSIQKMRNSLEEMMKFWLAKPARSNSHLKYCIYHYKNNTITRRTRSQTGHPKIGTKINFLCNTHWVFLEAVSTQYFSQLFSIIITEWLTLEITMKYHDKLCASKFIIWTFQTRTIELIAYFAKIEIFIYIYVIQNYNKVKW